ncbi:hypothetical protein ACWEWK_03715 [Streptomyces sp. NPDC003757]
MTASAVLFDVDGVLLDSAAAHRRVWDSWALSHGLDTETVWRLTFGRRPEDTVRERREPPLAPLDALVVGQPPVHAGLLPGWGEPFRSARLFA